MPWFRVDDNLAFHRKALVAGNEAIGLWTRAGSWAMANLTDGHVPDAIVLAMLGESLADRLIAAELWERVADGYQFHEWDERQPTAAQIIADREAARVRKERQRASGRSHAVTPAEPTPGVHLPQSQSQSHTQVTTTKTNPVRPEGNRASETDSTDLNVDVPSLMKNIEHACDIEVTEEEALAWAAHVLAKAKKDVKNRDAYLTSSIRGEETYAWITQHRT